MVAPVCWCLNVMIGIKTGYPEYSGIYKITNTVDKSFYIGSAVNIRTRWNNHKYQLRGDATTKHSNLYLQRAWNKYGEENFLFEVLAICPQEYLLKLEQWFIDNMKPNYNILKVAGSRLGSKRTKEQVQKASEVMKKAWQEDNKLKDSKIHRRKPIACYDENGKFLKLYEKIMDAERELMVERANIRKVLKGEIGMTMCYQFRLAINGYPDELQPVQKSRAMSRTIDIEIGNSIKKFKTIADACKKTGKSRYDIYKMIKIKKNG